METSEAESGQNDPSFVWLRHSAELIVCVCVCVCVPDRNVSLKPSDVHLQRSLKGPHCVLWSNLETHTQRHYTVSCNKQ